MQNKLNKSVQATLALLSFGCGVIIAAICLFIVEPLGEIAASAISIVSELLILCGALLGIDLNFDLKLQKFINDTKKQEQQ